jgi:hypothetical protein
MTEQTRERWAILARRSSGSRLGAATAWCKENGEVMLFDSHSAAYVVAESYNLNRLSPNISYVAARYE